MAVNLETGEPLWFGTERKKETLDEFFRNQLSKRQRERIEVDLAAWRPVLDAQSVRRPHIHAGQKQMLNELFRINRKVADPQPRLVVQVLWTSWVAVDRVGLLVRLLVAVPSWWADPRIVADSLCNGR